MQDNTWHSNMEDYSKGMLNWVLAQLSKSSTY